MINMADKKAIAVLTSGGDAPGMNVAVRSVVRTAIAKGFTVYGVKEGYFGLVNDMFEELTLRSVSDIINRGGTFLRSARCLEFKEEWAMQQAIENCKKRNILGLVVIGGDGSFRGAKDLSERGLPAVGIPATIDNDISASEYSIGFDTAIDTVMEMADRVRDTSDSHLRCAVLEVMGRHAGWLALESGIAVGASAIVVAEVPFDFEKDIVEPFKKHIANGKQCFIVVVAEGVGGSTELAKKIEAATGIESRATILGHVQRGGSPTAKDRIIATKMGHYAVGLLEKRIGKRVVVMRENKITDLDIFEALSMKKPFDIESYNIAKEVNI